MTKRMKSHTIQLRPNHQRHQIGHSLLLAIQMFMVLLLLHQQAKCSQLVESDSSHNLRSAKMIETSKNRTTNVADLRLTADYRAAKLSWIYRRNNPEAANKQQVEPASFDVRFCELTSWNAEIKCRHREMLVVDTNTTTDNSVITTTTKPTQASIGQLQQQLTFLRHDNDSIEYEARIFDLRALTNYTFQVRVLKFNNDEQPAAATPVGNNNFSKLDDDQQQQQQRNSRLSKVARRLSDQQQQQPATNNELMIVGRMETKPFRAEATKCLADASEVLITTGKYFGGRISVENSLDRRCQLLGNRSSEQTSYTFKIDHEICHSKVVNGNRIETMILVHENKDILTHNTARFLVLCNFLQKSFTLRASISLPKVNGLINNRPAVITPLSGKPKAEQAVLLGSMPGIFRAKHMDQASLNSDETQAASNQSSLNELDISSAIEKNAIRKMIESSESRQRQSKGLDQSRQRSSSSKPRPRSMELLQPAESTTPLVALPEPVQIQSKLLYVERQPIANLTTAKISLPTSESSKPMNGVDDRTKPDDRLEWRKSSPEAQDKAEDSIILTNNHRVAGDYKPTSSLKLDETNHQSSDGDLSIKYSGANVSEYSIGQLEERTTATNMAAQSVRLNDSEEFHSTPTPTTTTTRRGERTGRMQSSTGQKKDADGRTHWPAVTERRMGDMMIESGDLLAETSNNYDSQTSQPAPAPFNQSSSSGDSSVVHQGSQPNLAQNLTNYLLKWSLKTLTNLAKKSLQSLTNRSDSNNESRATESDAAAAAAAADYDADDEPAYGNLRANLPEKQSPYRTSAIQVTTIRPSSASSSSKPDISTSDDFDTHSRPQRVQQPPSKTMRPSTSTPAPTSVTASANEAQPTIRHASYHHHQPQQQHRASNYSKSLDKDRVEAGVGIKSRHSTGNGMQQSQQDKVEAERTTRDQLARLNESSHQHMREASGSISWLLVGCLLILALVIGALTIFCLASSYPSASSSSLSPPIGGQTVPAKEHVCSLPRLVFNGTIVANPSSETLTRSHLPSSCYADYNRFDNHPLTSSSSSSLREGASSSTASSAGSSIDDDSNNGLMLGNKQSAHLRPPLATRRSTHNRSNASQLAGNHLSESANNDHNDDEQNDCTNSELLLTEHILINNNQLKAANESYA